MTDMGQNQVTTGTKGTENRTPDGPQGGTPETASTENISAALCPACGTGNAVVAIAIPVDYEYGVGDCRHFRELSARPTVLFISTVSPVSVY